jgi:hypothetical protein
MEDKKKPVRHKIGAARTIETAVLCVAYLQEHFFPIKHRIEYTFTDPTPQNGYWSSDIIVEAYEMSEKESREYVQVCRAFVAGRGEIWT